MEHFNTSKLVAGYKTAFIDSGLQSDPEYSPQFISNTKGRKVLVTLEKELKSCDEMFMSVAFITQGGVEPLLGTLKELEAKGVKGRILTTDYLMFSEPSALDTLNGLSNIELRMVKTEDEHKGFHTKGYMFQKDDQLRIIVGSSNLTQGAITKNHEWNTRIVSTVKGQFAEDIEAEFNDLWNISTSYAEYREEYVATYKDKANERKALKKICSELKLGYDKILQPNAMQELFVSNIENFISMGKTRALLISATGTGKTYASAFAVRNILEKSLFRKKKVLFLSHREQINKQALKSYKAVFGDLIKTELLSGNHNNVALARSADFLFSTMQMMAKNDVREKFFPNDFSVIILDECHRSGAKSYQDIINYFKPSLLLGMSASPERTDDFDVFNLFDHNIACEIRLQQALENDMLCPFHYFGITDLEIDGNQSEYENFNKLVSDSRVNHIIKNAEYFGHSGDRVMGLVFCSSKKEARELSNKFNETRKYKTVALSGEDSQERREDAIAKLTSTSGERLDYIFTVDIFNEGVDIPEINQIIMLRQTESPIIFVQQLGRGLRKAENKEFVVIIDFIGNYENNYMIPIALAGDRTGNKDNIRRSLIEGNNYIQGSSTIYFDEISKKRIYASIDTAKLNRIAILKKEYQNLKYKLGRIPALSDFDSFGELDPLRIISASGSYYNFLEKYDEDYAIRLNTVQKEMLEFISSKFASGKRPHELEFLSLILAGSNNLMKDWENQMLLKYELNFNCQCNTGESQS